MRSHEVEPMPAPTLTDAAAVPAALTAFLRGVERRGAVFAQLQCGDRLRGDDTLAVAMRAFRNVAARVAVADWPRRFWALLLAAPPLRDQQHAAHWPVGFTHLGRLGHGPRAALLLRLVAGLSETDAAAVLGIARGTYRLALQRALPHGSDGRPDEAGWHALGEAAQQTIRELPAERLAHLARVREAAILGRRVDPQTAPAWSGAAPDQPRWWWPSLVGTGAVTLVVLAVTFLVGNEDGLPGDVRVRIRPLPPADAPAATYDADSALLTHRDFELLADAGVSAVVRDPAFFAWLTAQAQAHRAAVDAQPLPLADATVLQPQDSTAVPESTDAP